MKAFNEDDVDSIKALVDDMNELRRTAGDLIPQAAVLNELRGINAGLNRIAEALERANDIACSPRGVL